MACSANHVCSTFKQHSFYLWWSSDIEFPETWNWEKLFGIAEGRKWFPFDFYLEALSANSAEWHSRNSFLISFPFMPVNALMDWTVVVTHVKNGIDFPLLMEKNRIKSNNNKFFCLIFCFVTTLGSWTEKWRVARSFRDRKTDELDERRKFSHRIVMKRQSCDCWSLWPLHVTRFWCELLIASK